ncbi:MAG: hypothetical protein KGI54_06180 [Pseudomonadota bacterium]|nr:hypothetical protein [Pseudomonadota bacterium]
MSINPVSSPPVATINPMPAPKPAVTSGKDGDGDHGVEPAAASSKPAQSVNSSGQAVGLLINTTS